MNGKLFGLVGVHTLIIAIVFYFIGAKWPMLAQKTGIA